MEKTYFVRHSSSLDVDNETISSLWDDNLIAIHYPHNKDGSLDNTDSQSIDPADYSDKAKGPIKRLVDLARVGGYVFATYRGKAGGKVGYVEPGSDIILINGHWGSRNGHSGRTAVLKSLHLTKARNLTPSEAISFTSVNPRQGTICQWKKVGQRVSALISGSLEMKLENLTPTLQEVMCMEYLRTVEAHAHGLPIIEYTLCPVGRTMKDIDILGITSDGKTVCAQVTYKTFNEDQLKINKLKPYLNEHVKTIYFCRCENHIIKEGHHIFPLQVVFDEFCKKTECGRRWFDRATKG